MVLTQRKLIRITVHPRPCPHLHAASPLVGSLGPASRVLSDTGTERRYLVVVRVQSRLTPWCVRVGDWLVAALPRHRASRPRRLPLSAGHCWCCRRWWLRVGAMLVAAIGCTAFSWCSDPPCPLCPCVWARRVCSHRPPCCRPPAESVRLRPRGHGRGKVQRAEGPGADGCQG